MNKLSKYKNQIRLFSASSSGEIKMTSSSNTTISLYLLSLLAIGLILIIIFLYNQNTLINYQYSLSISKLDFLSSQNIQLKEDVCTLKETIMAQTKYIDNLKFFLDNTPHYSFKNMLSSYFAGLVTGVSMSWYFLGNVPLVVDPHILEIYNMIQHLNTDIISDVKKLFMSPTQEILNSITSVGQLHNQNMSEHVVKNLLKILGHVEGVKTLTLPPANSIVFG
jgi:hypothetical protein